MQLECRLVDGRVRHDIAHRWNSLDDPAQREREGEHRLLVADLELLIEDALHAPKRRTTRDDVRESDDQRKADCRECPAKEGSLPPENTYDTKRAGEHQAPRPREIVVGAARGRCRLRD